jgi:DNA-binding PadR family transcriptional regulator
MTSDVDIGGQLKGTGERLSNTCAPASQVHGPSDALERCARVDGYIRRMHTAYVTVRQGLLALLDQADMYGYQLRSEFEAYTGGAWPLNIGQVYTTLERLERDGLVAITGPGEGDGEDRPAAAGGSGGREHKYYAITRAGRDALRDWFEATAGNEPPPRDELLAKVLLALAGGREHALAVVARQRTALTAALQARRRALRPTSTSPGDEVAALAPTLVADALVSRAEADLQWLDVCEARLAQVPRPAGNGSTSPDDQGEP